MIWKKVARISFRLDMYSKTEAPYRLLRLLTICLKSSQVKQEGKPGVYFHLIYSPVLLHPLSPHPIPKSTSSQKSRSS